MNLNHYRKQKQRINITSYNNGLLTKAKDAKFQKRFALFVLIFMLVQVFSPSYSFIAQKKALAAATASTTLIHYTEVTTGYDGNFTGKTNVAEDQSTIYMQFAEAMDANTITEGNIHIKTWESTLSNEVGIPATVSYNSTTKIATINPDSDLNHYTYYYLYVNSNVKNSAHTKYFNQSGFRDKTKFRTVAPTAETVHPTITMITPSSATNAAKTTNVQVRFSEELTQTPTNYINLKDNGDLTVPVVKTWHPENHILTLNPSSDLTNGMRYYVTINSGLTDKKANTLTIPGTLPDFTVVADTVAPTITAINHTNIHDTSAKITWTTDEVASSVVCYSTSSTGPFTDSACTTEADTNPRVLQHAVTLTGLTAETKYYYVVKSSDAAPTPNTRTSTPSTETSFTTVATALGAEPVISNVTAGNITENSATITWDTDVQTSSQVLYGIKTGSYTSQTAVTNVPSRVQSHSVNLTGLTSGQTYYYVVKSIDGTASANDVTSSEQTFVAGVPQFTVTVNMDHTKGTLKVNDADATLTSDHYTDTFEGGTEVTLLATVIPANGYQFNNWTCGADVGTDAAYSVSLDADLNCTANFGVIGGATDTKAPVITNLSASPVSPTSADVSWTTDEISSSQVCYGTADSGPYTTCSTEADVTQRKTTHKVTLTGLTNGTEYFLVAKSKDSSTAHNQATSIQLSFILESTAGVAYDVTPDSTTVTKNGVTLVFRTFPTGVTGMNVLVTPASNTGHAVPTGKYLSRLYDISAVDQDGAPVSSGFSTNVVLDYNGIKSGDTVMYWDGSRWASTGISNVVVDPDLGTVSFDTTHFSEYAVLSNSVNTSSGTGTNTSVNSDGSSSDTSLADELPVTGGNMLAILINLILAFVVYLLASKIILRSRFGKVLC